SNLLEVEVAKHSSNSSVNRAERQADYWIFGGIYRPVFLEILPEIHMSRVAIDAKADGSVSSLIELNEPIKNGTVTMELFLTSGKNNRMFQDVLEEGKEKINVS